MPNVLLMRNVHFWEQIDFLAEAHTLSHISKIMEKINSKTISVSKTDLTGLKLTRVGNGWPSSISKNFSIFVIAAAEQGGDQEIADIPRTFSFWLLRKHGEFDELE